MLTVFSAKAMYLNLRNRIHMQPDRERQEIDSERQNHFINLNAQQQRAPRQNQARNYTASKIVGSSLDIVAHNLNKNLKA